MNKHLATLAIVAGSLVLCASGSAACATPSPMWPGQSSTGSKTDCSSDASGNSKKDCDKISPDRLSTKEKASVKTSQATSSRKSTSAANSGTKQAATSSSGTKAATASSSETKKDADKINQERMSTRGLKPPSKDASASKESKADTKPDAPEPK